MVSPRIIPLFQGEKGGNCIKKNFERTMENKEINSHRSAEKRYERTKAPVLITSIRLCKGELK